MALELRDPYASRATDPAARQVLDPHPATLARRAKLAITWESKNVTRDIAPMLDSLTYIDNLTGLSDELALQLADRDGLWAGDWRPETGDRVTARVEFTDSWFGSKIPSLRLGTFAFDKASLSGPPRRVSLQCQSAPLGTGLRRRKRTKTWRGVTLQQIAQDMADRAGVSLRFNGPVGGRYDKAVQHNKSDLEYLEDLCKDVGRTVKVTESEAGPAIAIFEEHELDGQPSVGTIDLIGGRVYGFLFDADDSARYSEAHIKVFDERIGKVVEQRFPRAGQTIPGLPQNGQTLELKFSASDGAQAAVFAEKMLRSENRFANRGKLSVMGDPGLVAGVTFDLTNAFSFDGKYIITRAEHHAGKGYTVDLDVRRVLEGY
jgi:phage protein D